MGSRIDGKSQQQLSVIKMEADTKISSLCDSIVINRADAALAWLQHFSILNALATYKNMFLTELFERLIFFLTYPLREYC
jgi:hypothetical protein